MKIEFDIAFKQLNGTDNYCNELRPSTFKKNIQHLGIFYGTGGGNFGDSDHGGNTGGIGTNDLGAGDDNWGSNSGDDGDDNSNLDKPPGSLEDVDWKPDKPPGSLDLDIYSDDDKEDNDWTPGRPPGSLDLDKYGVYQDGVYKDSVNILGHEISYDTHIHFTGEKYGFAAELTADMAESVFGTKLDEDWAKGIEVVSGALGIGLSIISIPTSMALLSVPMIGVKIAGVVALASHLQNVYSQITHLQDVFGYIPEVNTELESLKSNPFDFDNNEAKEKISNLIQKAKYEEFVKKQNLAHILNNDIYKFMAGGEVYNGVFAGGRYFDATKCPDTGFSVGFPYVMSEHARRIHAPYTEFLAKNQAGTDGFSVLF